MRGLIIKKPWIDYILDGKKTWEIRGNRTKIRGEIELIQSKSGLVVGCCELVDCKELTLDDYQQSTDKHQITDNSCLPYKRTYAWVLANAKRYDIPRHYDQPKGAIIWVKL